MTPEQRAEQFLRNHAGPVLYIEHSRRCEAERVENVDYLKFLRILFESIGALKK